MRKKFEEVTLTPKLAKEWLEKNCSNRKIKKKTVAFYADQIKKGLWQKNGETIKFSKAGEMLDGQHRCSAVIQANKSIKTHVVRGLDSKSFNTIDTGKARNLADVLSSKGKKNVNAFSAALRLLKAWEESEIGHCVKYSNDELFLYQDEHPGLEDSVNFTGNWIKKNRVLRGAASSVAHYLFKQADPELADQFFKDFIDNPKGALRTLENRIVQRKLANIRINNHEELALIIKTWNAWKQDKNITRLSWSAKEPFPAVA